MNNLWNIETRLISKGYINVCGVDEAGRGALVGPVFVAAVILPPNHIIEGLNDSKKLTPKHRDRLYNVIIENALDYSIAQSDTKEIEKYNVLQATLNAMSRAIRALKLKPGFVLIDGNQPCKCDYESECIIKGDSKSTSIAAASILAKVSRDRYMLKLHDQFPNYHFDTHKGYPTQAHYEAIKLYGVSNIHRRGFNLGEKPNHYTRKLGNFGEIHAVKYLESIGHKIIQCNFSCDYGEIDIISIDTNNNNQIVFTEVKTRSTCNFGIPAEAITNKKIDHIINCAKYFCSINSIDESYRIDLIEILLLDNKQIKLRHQKNII